MRPVELAQLPRTARILCLRLSALGDIVFALPTLHALRQALPQAELHWLTEDRHLELLSAHPDIDVLHAFPRRSWRGGRGLGTMWQHLRGLRQLGEFDVVLDFQGNLKSALQLMWLRSQAKIGFAPPVSREGAHRFLDQTVAVAPRQARYRRDAALLEACGWQGELSLRHAWPLPADVMAAMADGLPPGCLLFHCSTTDYGRDKAWAMERWQELALEMTAAGHAVRLLWTAAEQALMAHLVAQVRAKRPQAELDLAPATPSLAHLMALLDQAAMLIGTDSGPLHLAAYRGTPVVGLFGATDPMVYTPPGEAVTLVYGGQDGEAPPPRQRKHRSPWMDRITVAAVSAAIANASDRAGSPPPHADG